MFRYGISSNKLFDFMAASRPILFCCAAANNPVRDAGAGLSVPPGQPQALADAMLSVAALPLEERRKMGAAGRRYVEIDHGFDTLARRMAQTLDAAIAARRPS